MCTLSRAARAWASGRFTTLGVGCDGVSTLVPNATKSPAASRTTAAATAPMIQYLRRVVRPPPKRPLGGRPPRPAPLGSASKISPGPGPRPDRRRGDARRDRRRGHGPCRSGRRDHARVGQLGDARRAESRDGRRVLEVVEDEGQGRRRRQRGGQRTQARGQPGGVEASRGLGCGGARQHVVKGPERLVVRQRLADPRGQRPHRRVRDEGHRPGDRLVENQRQRVDVGTPVDRVPLRGLGRDVAGGPDHGAGRLGPGGLGQRAGDAEVGHPHPALLVEQEVRRLDVAVHQPADVGVGETLGHLGPELGGLGMGEPDVAVEQVAQRAPAEILEDQIRPVGVLAPVEDTQDVGVVERGDRARLGAEALQEGAVGGEAGLEDLDRDVALQRHVFGKEDVSRSAGAQSGEQPVPLP